MNEKIEKEIEEYFESNAPKPSEKTYEMTLKKIEENLAGSTAKKKISSKLKLIMSLSIILVVALSVVLGVLITKNSGSKRHYYMENELVSVDISEVEVQKYINDNYPKYNFLFSEEYEIENCYSYNYKNALTVLNFTAVKKEVPYTEIEFKLITDYYYLYAEDENYKKSATVESNSEYTMYYTEVSEIYSTYGYALFEYQDYRIYLKFDIVDKNILENFK